jgi:thiamine pyrophosphate-dependent acetolactate synthase large subunit-like protein
MAELTGAEVLVKALKNEGVRHVFGISGHGIVALIEALRTEAGIDLICPRQENASNMADGWSRATGSMGVCCSTVGPGASALAAGLHEAYADNSPVLAITANTQSSINYPAIGAAEEFDSLSYYQPITKWNAIVHRWDRIPELVQRAFREALTGRPGPVHLDFPMDILCQKGEFTEMPLPSSYRPMGRVRGDTASIEQAARVLLDAERPLLVAGNGVIVSQAWEEFRQLVDALNAAATTTILGSGSITADHPGFFGDAGWAGGDAILRAFREADVILGIGCSFSSWVGLGRPPVMMGPPQQKVIHIDIDPSQIGKHVGVEVGIVGDAKSILTDLLSAIKASSQKGKANGKWTSDLVETYRGYLKGLEPMLGDDSGPITQARLAREVGDFLDDKDTVVTIDGGMTFLWGLTYIHAHQPQRRLFGAGGGHLGYGQPFSLASKLAFPDRIVVNFAGDGGFGLTLPELDTAVRHNLPVINIINNDGSWGMIKAGQLVLYGEEAVNGIDQDFAPVNYTEVARGFGCYAEQVESPLEIKPALERALKSEKPAVLDVRTLFTPHPMFAMMAAVLLKDANLPMPQ